MDIAKRIEHTLLKPDTDYHVVNRILDEAIEYGMYGVCLPPYFVKEGLKKLENHQIRLVTVVGFPLGFHVTPVKNEELKRAFDDGADDVDVVINIAAVKSGDWAFVGNEIETLTRSAHLKGKTIKLILETGSLLQIEIQTAVKLGLESGVDVFKTSTGFINSGANVESIVELKKLIGNTARIKASGGIRNYSQALALIEAGADLIGTSSSIELIQESRI
jgi:deoxyribose-phosphate aldolase